MRSLTVLEILRIFSYLIYTIILMFIIHCDYKDWIIIWQILFSFRLIYDFFDLYSMTYSLDKYMFRCMTQMLESGNIYTDILRWRRDFRPCLCSQLTLISEDSFSYYYYLISPKEITRLFVLITFNKYWNFSGWYTTLFS